MRYPRLEGSWRSDGWGERRSGESGGSELCGDNNGGRVPTMVWAFGMEQFRWSVKGQPATASGVMRGTKRPLQHHASRKW